MKWFKHDTSASTDAKLQELLLDYGATGYGVYWYCIELIAGNVNKHNITFELEHDARIIARNLNLTIKETQDIMQKMIELSLFSISENERLACYALARRIDQSMTSSKHFRGIIDKFNKKNDIKSHDEVMISHDKVMTKSGKVMQDKIRLDKIRLDKIRLDKTRVEKKTTVGKSKFELFVEETKEAFKQNKILTFSSKINTTQKTKEAFNAFEIVPDDLPIRYAKYVSTNKSKGVRLDKWLLAILENNESDINYGVEPAKKSYKKEPQVGSIGWARAQMLKRDEEVIDAEQL